MIICYSGNGKLIHRLAKPQGNPSEHLWSGLTGAPCRARTASPGRGLQLGDAYVPRWFLVIGKSTGSSGSLPEVKKTQNCKKSSWTSLVAQWLRICLPMQGTRIRALLWEDPTCHGATNPVCHNYWACTLEPANHNYWSLCAQSLCSATREATSTRSPHTTTKSSLHLPQLEKASTQQRRPKAAKNKNK